MIAPVLITVYNRRKHFIECVESLAQCRLADQTHLFIASDAAKTDTDKEAVKEIRDYCANIIGFKKIDLLFSEQNMGAYESSKNAQERVFAEYDKFIFTEDDNVFSPNFLEFINEGLEFYKNNPNVFAICGYKHPFRIPHNYNNDVYVYSLPAAWGFGTWKEKYLAVDLYPKSFDISQKQKRRMPCAWNELMLDVVSNNKTYGDVVMGYHCLKKDMVNVYPVISLVQNHGHDGSGMHCGTFSGYENQEICTSYRKFKFIDKLNIQPVIEERIAYAIDYPFMNSTERIKNKIIKLLKKIPLIYKLYKQIKKMKKKQITK
jgi:glycosyltransferase involved in cell wall biosynthesis